MRTTWNGSLSFGLVSIPVGLAPATKPAARQSDVSFRLLHRECSTPIKQKRWCPTHDREVTQDEIVRGFEVTKGQFLIVEDADLEAIERADDSRSIEITRFVQEDDVDPIFFDRTYFLVPAPQTAQRRPYVLLLEAMRQTETAALGRFVRAGRESLCLVRAKGDALALETLFLAEDVYSQAEISEAVEETTVKKSELDLARQVIESLAGDFEPDGARERVPARPARAARGEDARRGDRRAGARRGRARDRPHGGAQGERRRGEEGPCRRRGGPRSLRARARREQGELARRVEGERAARAVEHDGGDAAVPFRTSRGRACAPSQTSSAARVALDLDAHDTRVRGRRPLRRETAPDRPTR